MNGNRKRRYGSVYMRFIILILALSNRRLNTMVQARTEELQHINIELNNSLVKTQKANDAKNLFLANMSHEIRKPVSSMISMGEILSDTQLDKHQRSCLDAITKSGNLLLSIINDILDFSKLESGEVSMTYDTFNLSALVNDINTAMQTMTEKKAGVVLKVMNPDNTPDYVVGDESRIHQVLINLLDNAIKFTVSGEVILALTVTEQEKERCRVRFSVKDTGIGIAKADVARIFTRFSQGNQEQYSSVEPYYAAILYNTIMLHIVKHYATQLYSFRQPVLKSFLEICFQVHSIF